MIELLIGLLVLAIVIYAVYVVLGMIPLPQPIKTLVWLILAVIFLVILLGQVGQGIDLGLDFD